MNHAERMTAFETSWSERHDLPLETLAQYRNAAQDGYRLPGIAKNYRTWCAAMDSLGLQIPADDLVIIGYLSAKGVTSMAAGRIAYLNKNATQNKQIPIFIHQSKAGE